MKRANDLRCGQAMSMRPVRGSVASWRAGLAQRVSELPAILGGRRLRAPQWSGPLPETLVGESGSPWKESYPKPA